MKPLKILYVINHLDWFWSHRLPLALAAQEKGYAVAVAASGAARDSRLTEHGFRPYDLPAGGGPARLAMLGLILDLRRLLLTEARPDIIHAITLKYAFATGMATRLGGGRAKNMRCVFTIAGLGYLFAGEGLKPRMLRLLLMPLLRFSLARATITVQNPDDLALLIRRKLVRADQCVLIRGSGVDTQHFAPRPDLKPNQPPLVLMPCRLVREKGVGIFAQAARRLRHEGYSARCAVAGGLDQHNPHALSENEMRRMTEDGTLEWLGRVSDMPALLARASVVAYPSYYGEGIPKVLLEAASMAKPIVTTDHPGCREVVEDGVSGLLVPVKDATQTARAIAQLLQDPARAAEMGRAAREQAIEQFDVRLIVRETLAVYESL